MNRRWFFKLFGQAAVGAVPVSVSAPDQAVADIDSALARVRRQMLSNAQTNPEREQLLTLMYSSIRIDGCKKL